MSTEINDLINDIVEIFKNDISEFDKERLIELEEHLNQGSQEVGNVMYSNDYLKLCSEEEESE